MGHHFLLDTNGHFLGCEGELRSRQTSLLRQDQTPKSRLPQ